MCHTIGGGPLAGPDLAGMSERRERSWLIRFIVDPQAVIDSGDPAAQAMLDEYQGMVMPTLPGLTHERAAVLVDYVREQSGLDQVVETAAAESEPFPLRDIELGRALFSGLQPLEAAGAACLACHDVSGLAGLGGGALGPELTAIHGRLGGRQGLESWLSAPPTPSMSTLYRTRPLTETEITALTAFLENAAAEPPPAGLQRRAAFLLFGSVATVGLLFGFHLLWRDRFRGVRRRLVESYRLRGVL